MVIFIISIMVIIVTVIIMVTIHAMVQNPTKKKGTEGSMEETRCYQVPPSLFFKENIKVRKCWIQGTVWNIWIWKCESWKVVDTRNNMKYMSMKMWKLEGVGNREHHVSPSRWRRWWAWLGQRPSRFRLLLLLVGLHDNAGIYSSIDYQFLIHQILGGRLAELYGFKKVKK